MKRVKVPWMPYICMTIAMAIVGSSVVAGKVAVHHVPVMFLNELRFIGASAILYPWWRARSKKWVPWTKGDRKVLVLQAFTGVFLFNVFMLNGVKWTTGIASGIITSTIPAAVGLIAFLFLREHLNIYKWVGILCAVAGTVTVNLMHPDGSAGTHVWLGNLLVFGAVLGEAGFITFGKSVSGRLTPLAISTSISLISMVMMFPFAVYDVFHMDFSVLTIWDFGIIGYFAVVVTVVAFVLMNLGLARVPAATAGIFTGVLPISAMGCSVLFLNETIHTLDLLAALLVVFAIVLISTGDTLRSRRRNRHSSTEESVEAL